MLTKPKSFLILQKKQILKTLKNLSKGQRTAAIKIVRIIVKTKNLLQRS